MQAHVRDNLGSVPDRWNEVNITIKQATKFSGFQVHVKLMVILYYHWLSVQQHYVWKNNVRTLKVLLLEMPKQLQ